MSLEVIIVMLVVMVLFAGIIAKIPGFIVKLGIFISKLPWTTALIIIAILFVIWLYRKSKS